MNKILIKIIQQYTSIFFENKYNNLYRKIINMITNEKIKISYYTAYYLIRNYIDIHWNISIIKLIYILFLFIHIYIYISIEIRIQRSQEAGNQSLPFDVSSIFI